MNPAGIYKERLSQSALFASIGKLPGKKSRSKVFAIGLDASGIRFETGAM